MHHFKSFLTTKKKKQQVTVKFISGDIDDGYVKTVTREEIEAHYLIIELSRVGLILMFRYGFDPKHEFMQKIKDDLTYCDELLNERGWGKHEIRSNFETVDRLVKRKIK